MATPKDAAAIDPDASGGFHVVSYGIEEDIELREKGASAARPRVPVVVIVLFPAEKSHAARVDAVVRAEAARLGRLGQRLAIVGVAPPYPLLVRWIPGGVAKSNRERDATELTERANAARRVYEAAAREHEGSDRVTEAVVHVVADGTSDAPSMVFSACAALCASPTAWGGAKGSVVALLVSPDSPGAALGTRTTVEQVIRHATALNAQPHLPITQLRLAPTPRNRSLPALEAEAATREGCTVAVVDLESASAGVLPPAVCHALRTVADGERIVLFAPIKLPEVSEAVQLTTTDWHEALRQAVNDAKLRLGDVQKAAAAAAGRLGLGRVEIGTTTCELHHLAAVAKAVETFGPRQLIVDAAFRRQYFLRSTWEAVRGAEYERVLRAHAADTHVTIML